MPNKQNNQDVNPETNKTEPANPCLDFEMVKMAVKYHEAMPQAIENIVALIDELETSGISYVSTDELKETLLKSFKED